MDNSDARATSHSEGDGNLSRRREEWRARNLDDAARALVDADSRYFFHQSLSTPCISAIRKAEGIWLEDMTGRRFMDFHGNNIHHIGYGHPRLVEALKRQIDDLPFTPRRFTDAPAVALAAKLASIVPDGLGKMLFATGGSDAIEM
ncbi:MAG: aminotransferase class III-fold pyridoxal phosphate-dependent enzyme, partial [Proteobacteria bacterium]|nr:aminotransferase class III-fold pyridoxal phosphate-dependent enzyme [Pseudomonadota bacterium]